MTRPALILRAMATADAVRRFVRHQQPMILQPLAPDAAPPAGWQEIRVAMLAPKHKSPSTIRRNQARRAMRQEGAHPT